MTHTCQPSRSRRDSPGLETETRRPARRPKKADSSRFVPINAPKHDFKPNFCLFSLFFSRNSSFFCVFWPFLMYASVVNSYPNKKSAYIRALFWLKSSFSCPLNVRKLDIFYRRFTRRADRRLPPGCYGNLIVSVKRGQSRPKRTCGVDPDRHDWATFTFTVIAEVRSCCTEMTKES